MKKELEKKREFRLEQSKEKLNLSSIMLSKSLFNDSLIFSYLSMFYSVRILLIEKNVDSDNHEKILELIERYYEPAGWMDINILEILHEAKTYKEKIENDKGVVIKKEEADKFFKNANLVLNQVLKITSLLNV
jgi:uncharacterized protein (UPF0332 family)